MKNIKIEEGIKASLGDLINKVQSITNENQSELAVQLFTPGFFVKKLPTGALEADWETSILDLSPTDLIRINTRGRNPAFCYTAGGKILSLKETTSLDPRDIEGYYHYNSTTTINNSNVVYELWVIPTISESEPVDYLPNYKQTGETKYLVDNYLAGFLLIKKGSTPPIINNETDSRPGSSTPIRQVFNTVEGIKLAEFTYRESTLTISNLIDFRLQNRAYLRPELYDFFNEAYLKHDFLLTHAEDSAGNNVLSFNKNGANPPTLSGTFSLVSSKERIVSGGNTYVSKIKVTASNVSVPVNSVLAITVTPADYVSATNLTKTLEVIPLNDYTPHVDKILIGYHLRTFLDNGIATEDNTGSTDVIENLGIGGSIPTPVNQQTSVIYFVNGLPPLPPGQNISRSGIGSYVLTKDEAAEAYYNKTKSDSRFIKSGNDGNSYEQVTHKNDVYHSIDGSTRTGQAYTGVKFTNATIPVGLYTGYAWLNHENNTLGYIHRGVNSGDNGYIELGVFKNDGSELRAFRLEDGFLKAIGPNEYPGNTPADGNKLVTVAYGLLNRGDDAKGNYNWRVGKFVFYQPSETYAPDSSGPINSENIPESSTVKVLQFNFDYSNPAVIDLLNHNITGSANPRTGNDGKRDLVPREFLDDKVTVLTEAIAGLDNKIGIIGLDYVDAQYHQRSMHNINLLAGSNDVWHSFLKPYPETGVGNFVYTLGSGWYLINVNLKINIVAATSASNCDISLDILKGKSTDISSWFDPPVNSIFRIKSENYATPGLGGVSFQHLYPTVTPVIRNTLSGYANINISKLAYLKSNTDINSCDTLNIYTKRTNYAADPTSITGHLILEVIKLNKTDFPE